MDSPSHNDAMIKDNWIKLSAMHSDNLLAYMHIYKCGGTTLHWVLQRAFPERVLYFENLDPSASHIDATTKSWEVQAINLISQKI